MNTNPRFGRTETPVNLLEPIELDFMAGAPADPARYGRTETPINLLDPIELDFAVPYLVLTLRLPERVEAVRAEILALDVLNLVGALGEYEKAGGGRGLRIHGKAFSEGAITLTLAPVAVNNALDRLTELAVFLDRLIPQVENPTASEQLVLEAIAHLEGSPVELCRAAFTRRSWSVEARIAMPV